MAILNNHLIKKYYKQYVILVEQILLVGIKYKNTITFLHVVSNSKAFLIKNNLYLILLVCCKGTIDFRFD